MMNLSIRSYLKEINHQCCIFGLFCTKRLGKLINRRRFKSVFVYIILAFFIMLILISHYSYPNDETGSKTKGGPGEDEISIDLSNNYFQTEYLMNTRGFLVDTDKCKIPELDIWDAGISRLIGPPTEFNCRQKFLDLTYVKKDTVVINKDVLRSIGYSLKEISCCYRNIERVEQSWQSYNEYADSQFRLSDKCIPMTNVTKPTSGFIKVTCNPSAALFQGTVFTLYTNFHLVAMIPEDDDNSISIKQKYWEDCLSNDNKKHDKICANFQENGRPPNVLVLGWDSTSRGNFRRFMPKTKSILSIVIYAIEMLGYNKVAENTFPNFVPLMTSYSAEELEKICYPNSTSIPYDNCPFIWKKFSDRMYLTGLMEDSPGIAIFGFGRPGFIRPPVDLYLRPFMQAAYQHYGNEDFASCIGYYRPEELILNYIVDIAELADSKNIPYFLTTWFTDLTHHSMNNLQIADEVLAKSLEKLRSKGLLENTVLLLVSDHGYRFLDVRTTTPGWFEDKLPTLWIKLPSSIRKMEGAGGWETNLKHNSRMLTTPFDIHHIFHEILSSYYSSTSDPRNDRIQTNSLRGLSPLRLIPPRTCDEAGIPPAYCTCTPPTACDLNSTFIKSAVQFVIEDINAGLPQECTQLKVASVTACGIIDESDLSENELSSFSTDNALVIVVGFYTKPGNFLFEAMVHYDRGKGQFTEVSKLSRMNKKTHYAGCLVVKDGWMQLLCYCKPSIFNRISFGILP